jgi:L-2-hydroxyglutarate oxidase
MKVWDFAVVGAGIVGCAIARELRIRYPEKDVVVIEKEDRVGAHTSGRNSGVIHSGINQKPGSLKAKLCVQGSQLLRTFCRNADVPMREVGTVVLARSEEERATLVELQRRAKANGVLGVQLLDQEMLKRNEPFARANEALLSPTGAIVNCGQLVASVAADAATRCVSMILGAEVREILDKGDRLVIKTPKSDFQAKYLVNCAGLHADQVAWMMDAGREYCVIPFRGDYYHLRPERRFLVNSMIYPAPNLELPFLGIHLTRRTDDSVIVGPNAWLALGREQYKGSSINWHDTVRMLCDLRFARLMSDLDFLKIALKELRLSLSKGAFAEAAGELVPEISKDDLVPDQSGIRAQLVDRRGRLADDFVFERTEKSFHVLNAVSPAMTSALAFAEHVADLISGEATD